MAVFLGQAQHALRWQAEATAGLAKTLTVRLWLDQVEYRAQVLQDGEYLQVAQAGSDWTLAVVDTLASASTSGQEAHGGHLTAPMPGKIIALNVAAGDSVKQGDVLLVMEAMKMEHSIQAPADGTVAELFFAVGDQVPEGAELVTMES